MTPARNQESDNTQANSAETVFTTALENAIAFLRQGKGVQSIGFVKLALVLFPEHPEGHVLGADIFCRFQVGADFDRTVSRLRILGAPDEMLDLFQLKKAQFLGGRLTDTEIAEFEVRHAGNESIRRLCLQYLLGAKKLTLATRSARSLVEQFSTSGAALLDAAGCFSHVGEIAASLSTFQRVVEIDADRAGLAIERIRTIHRNRGDTGSLFTWTRRLVVRDPSTSPAVTTLKDWSLPSGRRMSLSDFATLGLSDAVDGLAGRIMAAIPRGEIKDSAGSDIEEEFDRLAEAVMAELDRPSGGPQVHKVKPRSPAEAMLSLLVDGMLMRLEPKRASAVLARYLGADPGGKSENLAGANTQMVTRAAAADAMARSLGTGTASRIQSADLVVTCVTWGDVYKNHTAQGFFPQLAKALKARPTSVWRDVRVLVVTTDATGLEDAWNNLRPDDDCRLEVLVFDTKWTRALNGQLLSSCLLFTAMLIARHGHPDFIPFFPEQLVPDDLLTVFSDRQSSDRGGMIFYPAVTYETVPGTDTNPLDAMSPRYLPGRVSFTEKRMPGEHIVDRIGHPFVTHGGAARILCAQPQMVFISHEYLSELAFPHWSQMDNGLLDLFMASGIEIDDRSFLESFEECGVGGIEYNPGVVDFTLRADYTETTKQPVAGFRTLMKRCGFVTPARLRAMRYPYHFGRPNPTTTALLDLESAIIVLALELLGHEIPPQRYYGLTPKMAKRLILRGQVSAKGETLA